MPADVVEDQPFAQREIAERHLLGAEAAQDRVEQHGAGDDEVGASRIEPGHAQPLLELERRRAPCAARRICLAETRRLRSSRRRRRLLGRRATAPRLRIVPDVPMTRSKPLVDDLVEVVARSRRRCALELRARRAATSGSRLHEPLGQADDAELEAARQLDRWRRCRA